VGSPNGLPLVWFVREGAVVSAFLSMDSAESRSTLGQCSPGRFVRLRMLSFSVAFRPADETIPPIRADKVRAAMPREMLIWAPP
jgi:hypothetical protein